MGKNGKKSIFGSLWKLLPSGLQALLTLRLDCWIPAGQFGCVLCSATKSPFSVRQKLVDWACLLLLGSYLGKWVGSSMTQKFWMTQNRPTQSFWIIDQYYPAQSQRSHRSLHPALLCLPTNKRLFISPVMVSREFQYWTKGYRGDSSSLPIRPRRNTQPGILGCVNMQKVFW